MIKRDAAMDAAIRAGCDPSCNFPECGCIYGIPVWVRAAIAAWQAAQPALLPAPPPFNAQRVADINARGIIDEVCGEWAIETPQGFATALWDRLAASLSVAPSPSLPAEPSPGFVRVQWVVRCDPRGLISERLVDYRRETAEQLIARTNGEEARTEYGSIAASIVTADVLLPQPAAEVTGRVET